MRALDLCIDTALTHTGMESAGIYVADRDGGFNLSAHRGLSTDFVAVHSHLAADSPPARRIMRGQTLYHSRWAAAEALQEVTRRYGFTALALIPVVHEGKVVACVTIASRESGRMPGQIRNFLEAVAAQIGGCIARLKAEASLVESERRYQRIFQTVPVSVWEEDASEIVGAIRRLKQQGVTDFSRYFDDHPDFVAWAVRSLGVVDVNDAAVQMFKAATKEELLGPPGKVFTAESFDTFREVLIALAQEEQLFEAETSVRTLNGETLDGTRPVDSSFRKIEDPAGAGRELPTLPGASGLRLPWRRANKSTGPFLTMPPSESIWPITNWVSPRPMPLCAPCSATRKTSCCRRPSSN